MVCNSDGPLTKIATGLATAPRRYFWAGKLSLKPRSLGHVARVPHVVALKRVAWGIATEPRRYLSISKTKICCSLEIFACRNNSCLYQVSYGDGSYTVGDGSYTVGDCISETLTFNDAASVDNIAHGCGHNIEGIFVGAAGVYKGVTTSHLMNSFAETAKLGRPPTALELCLYFHTKDHGGVTFIDSRVEKILELEVEMGLDLLTIYSPNEPVEFLRRTSETMQTHILRVMRDRTLTQDRIARGPRPVASHGERL
ncbi:hypothetical protein Scep_018562 [Stephania cephalantha]|uniref:Uncharacterized protein n=1 Tax=Stephania cephalantha TaxID=152367 RepID=A0AAP0I9B0_9MAGN